MVIYRKAQESDIIPCTGILCEGFGGQLQLLFGPRLPRRLLADLLRVCLRLESGGFIVAEEGPVPAGFILVSGSAGRLFYRFAAGGFLPLLLRVLAGRYENLSLRRVCFAMGQFFMFNLQGLRQRHRRGPAGQVILLGVAWFFRRRGIGMVLLREGLGFLKKQGVSSVKLEVRSGNEPALRLYRKEGFTVKGKIKTVAGISLIMTRNI